MSKLLCHVMSLSCLPFFYTVGSDSSNGGVTNPKCGGPFSVPGGKGLSFFCRPPLYGKYVTIRNLRQSDSTLTLCEVEVYSEKRGMINSYSVICKLSSSMISNFKMTVLSTALS